MNRKRRKEEIQSNETVQVPVDSSMEYKSSIRLKGEKLQDRTAGNLVEPSGFLMNSLLMLAFLLLLFITLHISILIYLYWKENDHWWLMFPVLSVFYWAIYYFYPLYTSMVHNLFVYLFAILFSHYNSWILGKPTADSVKSKISITETQCFEAFQLLDKDRDGFITIDDLQKLVDKSGKNDSVTSSDVTQAFNLVDSKKGGKLSYIDFHNLFVIKS
jgi:hypothetical protein